jgi:hypothetical protein
MYTWAFAAIPPPATSLARSIVTSLRTRVAISSSERESRASGYRLYSSTRAASRARDKTFAAMAPILSRASASIVGSTMRLESCCLSITTVASA